MENKEVVDDHTEMIKKVEGYLQELNSVGGKKHFFVVALSMAIDVFFLGGSLVEQRVS